LTICFPSPAPACKNRPDALTYSMSWQLARQNLALAIKISGATLTVESIAYRPKQRNSFGTPLPKPDE